MTKLYFIRHGQTIWNLEKKFQGQNGDSPLLPGSYKDIKLLADYLAKKNIKFDACYSSPMKRAFITADNLLSNLDQKLEIQINSGLSEVMLGDWEGKYHEYVSYYDKENFYGYKKDLLKFNSHEFGAESFEEAQQRFVDAIVKICDSHKNTSDILIVSHGLILSFGINSLLKIDKKDIKKKTGLSNTSLTILETDNNKIFNCIDWNNTSFLNKKIDETNTL